MKKILFLAALFCSSLYSMAGTINISTSTNAGAYVAPPNADPNWQVSSSFLSLTAAYAIPTFTGYWEATPVAVTNAGWINPTPNLGYDVPGIYTFERSFPVSQCTQSIACNFKIAFDDTLILLELVPPSGPSIPLTVSGGHYFLSSAITNVVTSPAAGLWKVRATVHYIDQVGGFILSGNIDDTPSSDCCKENVSTGISNNWVLAPGSPVGPATYVVPAYTPYWQPTPVPPLNSQWISPTTSYNGQTPGDYIYERSFVSNGTFESKIAIAFDDSLVRLELVRPDNSVIPLTSQVIRSVNPTPYYLSNTVSTIICNDLSGVWKIRAVINYIDAVGGFMLSGTVDQCPCDSSCKFSLNANGTTFTCGKTLKLKCATNYDFNPQLTNCSSNCSAINSATLTDPSGNTPSWAAAFVANHGAGGLSIPLGVTGTFTLTYTYGINGRVCGTCSYIIKITCPSCKACQKNIVRNSKFQNIPTVAGTSDISPTPSTNWFATQNTPQYYAAMGCCDSGYVLMWGNKLVGEQITQTNISIIAGHQYKITFNGRFVTAQNSNYVKFRFTASTSIPTGYGAAIVGGVLMGLSPQITDTVCRQYNLPVWTAPANYSVISINPENQYNVNDGAYTSWGSLDNLCITDVTPGITANAADDEDAITGKVTVIKASVLPNPFNNSFRISRLQNKTALLDIINMQGITVAHYKSVSDGNSFGENLKAGVYLLRFTFDDGTAQLLKVVKE